ncbi:dermonecrotic toxin domain-containing protein [Pseudomonas sp. NFX224]|uniref:dermonecrotic toxin domain-containing protein n=1 Tax=Pseudomonas sp. NFX224 TaxID=3402862 RepID=UPI003AFA4DEE
MNIQQTDIATGSFRPDAHYQHLINAIPSWLHQATPQRREALRNSTPGIAAGLKNAPPHQHAELGKLIVRHVTSQNQVDQMMAKLQSPADFAEPLLEKALKSQFGLELDARRTFLQLYIPAHIPWLRLKSGAARIWTVSLLDAALHNFESAETEADAFEPASTYITPPSATGHFNTLPQMLEKMSITAFTRLCRELDIGQRYKEYLDDNLGLSNLVAAARLKSRIHDSQKTALTAALHMAQMQKLLGSDAHRLMLGLLDNLPHLRLHGQPWGCHELTIMNARLTGIVLFAPDLERATDVVRVVAYIPDAPQHPIKEYSSTAAFAEELGQRLRDSEYQQFFSRFIDHEDRGHFFAQLNNELSPVTWQPVPSGDPRPTWRERPNQHPDLHMTGTLVKNDLWTHLYQSKLNKILNDARVIAVSTATVDQRARWALWDSFTEIASTLLNIAAFIALPFVPFLGELMLAYIAYQLLDETFESIVDWAEGHTTEAFGHFMGVVESAVQLGSFAVGGGIVAREFRAILPKEIVQYIDRFNSVKRPNGETRYWKPDLTTYEHPATLPADSTPDSLGLHRYQGKTLLPLEGKNYAVSEDSVSGEHRIDHPSRPEVYKPQLKHYGAGAWQTELDQPLSWDQATVLQRVGPDMQRFAASTRERILSISGCHEDALRKMHVNAGQVPPLLADTLKRFTIDQDIQTFIDQIGSDQPERFLKADPVTQMELLNEYGYWPENKGLRLIDENAQTLWQSPSPDVPVVQIDTARLTDGDLLKTFLLSLPDSEARTLLGEEPGHPFPTPESRAHRLRQILARLARQKRQSLFEQRYRRLERGARSAVQIVKDAQPGLPNSVADAIVNTASDLELQQLKKVTVAPRLTELSLEAGLQVRVTRSYEGLDLPSTENNLDTHRLALHTLEKLPGWTGQLRLEIRRYSPQGPLFDSLGSVDAPLRKILVLGEEGSYQAFDHDGEELSAMGSLYTCLLQAMPDSERTALNLHIGEGERLKQLIRQYALSRDALRARLIQHPDLKPTYDPKVMRLLGGSNGYRRMPTNTPTLQTRAQTLFPHLSVEQLDTFVERLQRHPSGPRAELSRLMAQHTQLHETLSSWRDEIPLFIPDTQIRVTPEQFAVQKQLRQQFTFDLMDCWRQQWTLPESGVETAGFNFFQPIIGELPTLSTDFSGVTMLSLNGSSATRGMHEFLRCFTGLRILKLSDVNLGRLPDTLPSLQLKELILSNCAITLSPESQAGLAGLHQLSILDLYNNPLGLVPDIGGMPDLNYIDLSQTGLTELPRDLMTRPHLRSALLNGNQVKALPDTLFTLQRSTQEGFDLGNNPLSTAARERLKQHFLQTRQDFGIFAEETDTRRAQALYPWMDQEDASKFIYQLPGTLGEGRAELTRREAELATLENDLSAWTADIPAVHPHTHQPFTAQQLLIEHSTRDAFRESILRCWRREIEPDDFNDSLQAITYDLSLDTRITGSLPTLSADFSHVSLVYLSSESGLTTDVTGFLECFPKLETLVINDFSLGDIPDAIFRMSALRSLNLPDCNITLTPQSVLNLAEMARLEFIDLRNNPLGLAPDISQITDLATLQLDNCELTELPAGLMQLKSLETVDLSDNAISQIPADLIELPLEVAESISLRGNPLSEESLQILLEYFRLTSVDFGVQAVIERAELEVSSSETSEPEN